MSSETAESPAMRKRYGRALDPDRLSYELAIRNWDRRDLAARSGVAASTISQVCAGVPVTRDVRQKIAKALAAEKPDPAMVALVAKSS